MPVDVATQLLSQQTSEDEETLGALLRSLRRSLAHEGIDDQLWDSLDAVLGEFAPPAPHDMASIAVRLRTSTTKLVEVVPYLLRPYPLRQMQRLIFLSAEHPRPEGTLGHLNRFAMGILSVLDLMGDDAL
ncbi:hypothetical protein F7R91_36885 [Streptomyces luteolifulvus]|uniref:Uncharacterized protein n=1 Tax=Streptomyces luteolifulvus TaxID=2615112 RepID=A0A6H9UQ67_9ACTN|nr:hypothetical protein F7R91_36885 [Streptomyces luteolifulvus]